MAADTKNMNEEKSAMEKASEEKATAEGDLATTVKDHEGAQGGWRWRGEENFILL